MLRLAKSIVFVLIATTVPLDASRSAAGGPGFREWDQKVSVVYVRWDAAPDGDGTARAPLNTIRAAIQHARAIRDRHRRTQIVVQVAPGTYAEALPLYLDVSNTELRGSTVLREDADGRPDNCGTHLAALPCIEPGTETVLVPVASLGASDVMLAVAPRIGAPDDTVVSGAAVHGFVFDGRAADVAVAPTAIYLHRVGAVTIRGNVIRSAFVGISTRLASATIRGNFLHNCNAGMGISGGSATYPAVVDVIDNRVANNSVQGIVLHGAAGLNGKVNLPEMAPRVGVYDRDEAPELVPDTLAAVVRNNVVSRNASFGIRMLGYGANNSSYSTVTGQPMTAAITATLDGNSVVDHTEYGILVEGGFVSRSNPRVFTARFDLVLRNNELARNRRAPMFAGFMLNGVVTRNPALLSSTKYIVRSKIALRSDHDLADLDYDNPALDPYDGVTPLANRLEFNGMFISGSHVTCGVDLPCPK